MDSNSCAMKDGWIIHWPSKKRLLLRSECAAMVAGLCGHTLWIAVGGTLHSLSELISTSRIPGASWVHRESANRGVMLIAGMSFSCGGAGLATACFIEMRLVFLWCSLFKKCFSSGGSQKGFVVCTHVRRFQMSRTAFEVIPNSLANRLARRFRFVRSCLAALKMVIASFEEIVHTPLPCEFFPPGEGVLEADRASLSNWSSSANDTQLCSSKNIVRHPESCAINCDDLLRKGGFRSSKKNSHDFRNKSVCGKYCNQLAFTCGKKFQIPQKFIFRQSRYVWIRKMLSLQWTKVLLTTTLLFTPSFAPMVNSCDPRKHLVSCRPLHCFWLFHDFKVDLVLLAWSPWWGIKQGH